MINKLLKFAAVGGCSTLLLAAGQVTNAAERVEVAGELQDLAEIHGFDVTGLEQTAESFVRAEGDELFPRLRRLLEKFDHVIIQDPAGNVERVIVLGEKVPFVPAPPAPAAEGSARGGSDGGDIVLPTERRGTQHVVRVSLAGRAGAKVERELHVDTGADYLVLPLSLVEELGIDKATLESRDMQTANGKVKGRVGLLPALWLGERRIVSIETAFLDDDKLGNKGLLGMSVLGRFKLTIDDDENTITLGSKAVEEAAKDRKPVEVGVADPGDRIP